MLIVWYPLLIITGYTTIHELIFLAICIQFVNDILVLVHCIMLTCGYFIKVGRALGNQPGILWAVEGHRVPLITRHARASDCRARPRAILGHSLRLHAGLIFAIHAAAQAYKRGKSTCLLTLANFKRLQSTADQSRMSISSVLDSLICGIGGKD